MIDLDYRPESLLPPLTSQEIKAWERRLSEFWERRIWLPRAYVEHILTFHGGLPGRRCFRMPNGGFRVIGRFFNWLDKKDPRVDKGEKSWRSWGSDRDIRLDYRVEKYLTGEYWAIRLQEHDETLELLPIAGLAPEDAARSFEPDYDFDGEDEFDLLCLNFAKRGEPPVVVWRFANDWSEPPVIQSVARSFEEFLPLLYPLPQGAGGSAEGR